MKTISDFCPCSIGSPFGVCFTSNVAHGDVFYYG